MQKYNTLYNTIKYNYRHIKNKLVFDIINYLFKYTDRHLFYEITVQEVYGKGGCAGKVRYAITSDPHPVIKCDYITDLKKDATK